MVYLSDYLLPSFFLAALPTTQGDEAEELVPEITAESDRRLRLTKPEENSNFVGYPSQSEEADLQTPSQPQGAHRKDASNDSFVPNNVKKAGESEDDSDFDDSDFDDDDDDPAMAAFRARRLAELKKMQIRSAENKAKGHGEYRTISQDEFLPECTNSDYVAVHFFHDDFGAS